MFKPPQGQQPVRDDDKRFSSEDPRVWFGFSELGLVGVVLRGAVARARRSRVRRDRARGSHARATRTHSLATTVDRLRSEDPERRSHDRALSFPPFDYSATGKKRAGAPSSRSSRDGTLPQRLGGAGLPGAGAVRVADARGGRAGTFVAHQRGVLLPVGALEDVQDVEVLGLVARDKRREDLGHRRERVH